MSAMADFDLQLEAHIDTAERLTGITLPPSVRDAIKLEMQEVYARGFRRGETAGKCAVIATRLSRYSPQTRGR